jgi:hypothetical protein
MTRYGRMSRRQSLLLLAVGGFAWSAGPLQAAPEWVDMGPVDGSVQGHVWSKVIDEVGNTQARYEVWQVALPSQAEVEFAIQAPDPHRLDVRILYTGVYGDPIEHLLSANENVFPGGYRHVYGPWAPEGVRNIRIAVATRDSSTDQIYQLTVRLSSVAGAPTDGAAADRTVPAALLGTWLRNENGQLVESMEIAASGEDVTLTFFDGSGGETGRATGVYANGRLTASNPRRLITIVLQGTDISYTSTDHDGGNPWSGQFHR